MKHSKVTQKNVLSQFKNVSKQDALTIVKLVNGTLDPETLDAGRQRVSECYNRPDDTDLILTCINKILGGYGVEGAEWRHGAIYSRDFISYVNMGDTYKTTILYHPETCEFMVSDWGSVYEESPAFQAETDEDPDDDEQDHEENA